MPRLPSVPGSGVGRAGVERALMTLHGGRARWQPCPGVGSATVHLATHSEAASDLGTECSWRGGCNLLVSHLLTVDWGSGPMGRGRLTSSRPARAPHFHCAVEPVGHFKDHGGGEKPTS